MGFALIKVKNNGLNVRKKQGVFTAELMQKHGSQSVISVPGQP